MEICGVMKYEMMFASTAYHVYDYNIVVSILYDWYYEGKLWKIVMDNIGTDTLI